MRISDWSSDVCSSDLYNVPNNGVVLNNGTRDPISRQSQLAGQVTSNLNLDRAAKVILNEVVGPNRSVLSGYTEVVGSAANVIVANPYGVTCTRSEEHTSELQSLMRISYAVFCLQKTNAYTPT